HAGFASGLYLCRRRPESTPERSEAEGLDTLSRAVQSAQRGLMLTGHNPLCSKQLTTMEYPKTARSAEEFLVCTELLPAIRRRYGPTFALLEIPEILRSDGKAGEYGTVYFRDYVGEKYNDRWNEGNGGGPLGTE